MRPLTISDVVKIESQDGMANITHCNHGTEGFRDDLLPDQSLGGTVENKMIDRIGYRGTNHTQRGQMDTRKHTIQEELVKNALIHKAAYSIVLHNC